MRGPLLAVLLLLSLVSLPSTLGQTPTPTWSHFLRIDCDGTFEIIPSIGLGVKFPILRNLINEVLKTFLGRAQCLCPNATRADFDLLFDPVTAMLNNIKATPNSYNQCLRENLPRSFDQMTMFRIDLPNTCTYESWATNGTCGIKHSFPRVKADLQLALSKCPNSFVPSVSITCAGDGCSTLGRPCASNADCMGLSCFDLGATVGTDFDEVPDDIFRGLREILVYGANDTSPGCYQAKRGSSAKTPENDIMTYALSFIAKNFFSASSNYNRPQFCGILELVNFTVPHDSFSLNDTGAAGAEAHIKVIPSSTSSCLAPESSNANEMEEDFSFASGNDGVIDWLDGIRLLDSPCPGAHSQAEFCPSNNAGSSGGPGDQNNCRSYEIQSAYYPSHENWYDTSCFPDCERDLSGVVVTKEDIHAFLDAAVSFAESYEGQDHYNLLNQQWTSGPFGTLINNYRQWYDASSFQKKGVFSKRLETLLSIYQWVAVDGESLADQSSRSTARMYFDFFLTEQNDIFNALRNIPLCANSRSVQDLRSLLSNNADGYFRSFDQNKDGTLSTVEGFALFNGGFSSVAFSSTYRNFYSTFYSKSDVVITEMSKSLDNFFGVFSQLWDLDQDGVVTGLELSMVNFFNNFGKFDFVSEEFWPLNVTKTSFLEDLDFDVKAIFDSVAPSGTLSKTSVENFDAVDLPGQFFQILMDSNLFTIPFSGINTELDTKVVEAVFSVTYNPNDDESLTFSEGQSYFQNSPDIYLSILTRGILSAIFTSKPNGEMSWEDFSSSLDEMDKFNQTTRLHITVPGLKPWNGIESGGTSAFTRPSVIPPLSKIPDRTVLAQFTCDQNLIFETHNVGLLLSQRLQKVFPQATSLLKDLIACRSNPADNDMARFLVRYGVWAPLLWLHVIDESSANYPLPEGQEDWVRSFFGQNQGSNIRINGLPSSCNFYHFLETGSCELDFVGLKTLLLADITIRISLKSCGPSSAFSSFTFECLGQDCGLLSGLNPCDTDSQCSSGLLCTPLPRITAYLSNQLDSPRDTSYFENLRFNETLLTDFILKTDFFGLFFSKDFNGNLCSSPSFFDENSKVNIMDYFGNYPQGECFGPDQWSADVQRILVNLFGSENPNTGIQSKLHFCTPDLSVFDLEAIQRWASTLVIVDGPTVTLNPNIFKAVSAPVPTSPPTGLPTCRCSTSCGSLASACSKCYQAGGMVVPNAPSICFCPSNGQSLPAGLLNNWDVTMDPLCASPLPECANCTSCAVSCATCFGTASSQCLSCTNPSHLFITKYDSNGALISGRCLPPCQEGQYRNSDGICVDPDCSGLSSCSGNGICFHSEFTQDDRCRCNDGFYGNDCSKVPSCAAFDDCNGHGSCVYNQHFRAGRCQCYPGYTLDDCSHAIVKFTPNYDTELGGSEITVVHPDGFGIDDEVECQFGSTVVAGKPNNDGSASCIAPPSAEVRVAIQTAVRKNGGDWSSTEESFFYYFSEKLVPRSEAQLHKLEWRNGTLQQITWSSNDACMYPIVNIYLIPWNVSQEAGTVTLGQKVLLAGDIATDDGAADVTANIPFSLTNPLYVLSIEGPRCSINRYVIPVDATPNYGSMCQSWVTAEATASRNWTSGLPGCAPNRWIRDPGFEAYPHCSAQNAAANPVSNCYTNLGATECRFSTRPLSPNFGGQTCCYSQGGDLLTNRATGGGNGIRYGMGSNGAIRVVATFVGDILPGLLCCRLSDKCSLFSGVRPTSTENAWIPPRTGGASGDPHLVTLDGKFWTFNGLGEYVLLERTDSATSDFVLQARFARAPSMNVNAANATVLKGFAVRDDSKVVSGYLGELEGLILFVDGQEVPALSPGSSFLSPNGGVVLFAQADKYVISLPSGASLEVSAAVSMISLVTLLPASFKGKTRGLMGTWDQNKNNDFLLRNGTTLPFDATQETLFHAFGEPYRVSAQSSLFTYPDDEGFADYNDLDFIPAFITPSFPSEEARNIAMAACAQAPSVDACLYDVAQTGDIRVANVALKSGAVFQTFASAANTPPSFTNPPAKVNVRLGQNVTVQFAVADAEHQEVSLNALTSPEGGSLQGLTFSFKVVNGMYLARSVVPLKVVAVDEGGSVSDPAVTNFTVVFSTCADGKDAVELEASLDLAAFCLSSGCSDECAASISRIIALEDTCRKEVISDLGETFTQAREKCCSTVQTISCADKATGGLSPGAIAGIAVGVSIGGLALIGIVAFFVFKGMKGKGKDEENEMKDTRKK